MIPKMIYSENLNDGTSTIGNDIMDIATPIIRMNFSKYNTKVLEEFFADGLGSIYHNLTIRINKYYEKHNKFPSGIELVNIVLLDLYGWDLEIYDDVSRMENFEVFYDSIWNSIIETFTVAKSKGDKTMALYYDSVITYLKLKKNFNSRKPIKPNIVE